MGCDIHIVVEYKYKGKWIGMHACESTDETSHSLYPTGDTGETYDDMPKKWSAFWRAESRNYELFTKLSGVRGDDGPEPNGLPADISDLGQMIVDQWGEDGHSHSHYTLRECGVHFLAAYAPKKLLTDDRVRWLVSFFGMNYHDQNHDTILDDIRLIILYDN